MKKLRRQALLARRNLSVENRADASELICEKVIRSKMFSAAKLIACYLPMKDEVDTRNIINRAWCANKRIFVPITRGKGEMFFREIRPNTTLHRNKMSIWEPASGEIISSRALQLVITPTVAFDGSNNRIGMGGGYYDRCFSYLRHRKVWITPKLFGVAFQCQKVDKITPNPWDIRLYKTFSETS
jgi:5-formyltetrahydrofolate cyclo-ligase